MLVAINNNKDRVSIYDTSVNEKYYCPLCNEELVLKKGPIRRHHFAHKANGVCSESKYSDMCDWHINWQERFPKENIEIIKIDSNGKKHIADVLINNIEIEFQHSFMPFEEFNSRNEFYSNLNYRVVWIFDGNDVFDSGFNGGNFPFSKKFECLKNLKIIPDYLDIFIEGKVNYNLLSEEGLFLHHVGYIDEKNGIIFDKKCTIEDFVSNVCKNGLFNFNSSRELINTQDFTVSKKINYDKQNILSIAEQYPNADYLVVYNSLTNYDVLIDKYNINRLKQGKTVYGKLKTHGSYGKFTNQSTEIYYVKSPIWTYQTHY